MQVPTHDPICLGQRTLKRVTESIQGFKIISVYQKT